MRAVVNRGMATRVPIVGGNWKLNAGNGVTKASVKELVDGLNKINTGGCEVYCAPPTLYVDMVQSSIKKEFQVSAQNVYKEEKGAFTGETSTAMLNDMGVKWTLIGHSERRDYFGETDELLGQKIAKCQEKGISVAACIGEQKADRESGKTMDVLIPQLKAIADNTKDWSKIVIAYEPVWAIGTGLTATPEMAQETHANIRAWVKENVSPAVAESVRIQYGGSANEKNAAELFSQPDIDGFLCGGASLKADAFAQIIGFCQPK